MRSLKPAWDALEQLFYETLAPTLSMRVPAVYVARQDDRDGSFILLMEDLVSTGCRVSDGTWGVPLESAARALEDLAALHLYFLDPARRAAEASWVPPATRGGEYGAIYLRKALAHHRDRMSDDFAAISEIYIDRRDELQALWQSGPTTVIHGDTHIGNLFFDQGRTGFLDWGVIKVSTPLRDVSYFLTMAMAIEDRRAHERELLRHYLDIWNANSGIEIGFDRAWLTHRIQAAYNVPASCQIVTFPPVSEARRIFSEAFLARAEASIQDLESRAALRDAAGL